MAKLTFLSVATLTMLLAAMLALGALGLAVREGVTDEVLFWLPPGAKYQLIVRIGADALPWQGRSGRGTAINIWAHGRDTDWHIVRIIGVPIGAGAGTAKDP